MKWKKLLSGAGMLGLCAAAAKLLGAFFRIPLTNILGAEGIGLYQMVFPLYTVLLTISSGGLSSAISKVIASRMARSDEAGALKILKVSAMALMVLGLAAAVFLIIFRKQISALQGNSEASLAYLGIAPAVVFVALISCLRGYFQGRGNMLPSGISQIAEQLVKLILGLFFASLFMPYGISVAVLGAVLGVTVSELFAMLLLMAQFFAGYFKRRKTTLIPIKTLNSIVEAGGDFTARSKMEAGEDFAAISGTAGAVQASAIRSGAAYNIPAAPRISDELKTGDILKSLYRIAIPITLGSLIMPLTQVIDSVLVINVLISGGMSRAAATSLFGLVSGPINSLINMPIAVMLSISVALLPRLAYLREKSVENIDNPVKKSTEKTEISSENYSESSKNKLTKSTEKSVQTPSDAASNALKITLLLSLPSAVVFMAFSERIVSMLYSSGLSAWQMQIASSLLKIESLSIFYISMIQVATAVLQGADKPHRPAINLLYGAVTKVILTLLLLPLFGIRGAAAASVVCYAVIAVIDLFYMRKVVRVRLDVIKAVVMPLLACAVLVGLGYFGFWVFGLFLRPVIATAGGLILGGAGYCCFLLISKSLSVKEFLK